MSGPLREEILAICRSIDAGEIQPRRGAGRIWVVLAEADYPSELDEFRVFVGFVSEMQDHPEQAEAYAVDILAEARAVIERSERS
jgi:hypothetical protein